MLYFWFVPAFHFIPDRKNREMPFQSGLKTLACANETPHFAQAAIL